MLMPRRCEKCGSEDVSVAWHDAGSDHSTRRYQPCRTYGEMRGKPAGEHLHYHCRTCQYDWTGPLTPASPVPAVEEDASAESLPRSDEEPVRDALRRLNPEFHDENCWIACPHDSPPVPAVEAPDRLGKFGHHPDETIDAEVEIGRLEGLLAEAHGGLLRALDFATASPEGLAIKADVRDALRRTGRPAGTWGVVEAPDRDGAGE